MTYRNVRSRSSFSRSIRFRIPMRIETSSMLVGSSARTIRGSTASARAIATRCRCPPESSCGYLAATSSDRHEADRVQQLERARPHLSARDDVMDAQRPLNVVAHGLDRVQRVEGVLEDDLHLRAVVEDVAPPLDPGDVAPFEQDGAVGRGVQPCEQPRDGALAAPALADQRRDRAGPELERDVVDGVHVRAPSAQRASDREALAELPHLERSGAHCAPSSTRWQATRCPGSTSRSTGRSVVCRR